MLHLLERVVRQQHGLGGLEVLEAASAREDLREAERRCNHVHATFAVPAYHSTQKKCCKLHQFFSDPIAGDKKVTYKYSSEK